MSTLVLNTKLKRKTRIPADMKQGTKHQTKNGGILTVVEYLTAFKVKAVFSGCDNVITARAEHIRSGSVRNPMTPSLYGIGYLGVGDYSYSKHKKAYNAWSGMFTRCYNADYHEKQPTYVDCEVGTTWHNFQNFAEWFYSNCFEDAYLDKDILIQGNKVYSPEKCLLVTRRVNNLMLDNKARRGMCRLGVSMCSMTGKYKAEYVNSEGKSEYLGLFTTDIEAHEAYKKAKYALIKSVALQQSDERISQGLLNWVIPER